MASQVTSGYATEGTQYAQNGSFYILDTVPGSGSAIPGPVTVTGNLTVTGTTTLLGAAAAPSFNTNTITAPGPAATYSSAGKLAVSTASTASDSLTLTSAGGATLSAAGVNALNLSSPAGPVVVTCGPAHAVTVQGAAISVLATGTAAINSSTAAATVNGTTGLTLATSGGTANLAGPTVALTSGAGNINLTAATATSRVNIVNSASNGIGIASANDAVTFGYDINLGGETFMTKGLAVGVGQGTFAAPQQVPQPTPGANVFQMTTQKAFLTTGVNAGGVAGVVVLFPTGGAATQNWIPLVGQIGVGATNVASVYTNGASCIVVPSNPLNPMTFSIALL